MTALEIQEVIESLGLKRGDYVMLHASLSSIGCVEGGADAVIDALIAVLGPEGLLMMPSFGCRGAVFDRKTSETNLGIIADTFWRRPDVVRSHDPCQAVAAWGKGKRVLIEGHERQPTSCGEGTPYHQFCRWGGKVLLLGCDQDRNTILHTA